MIERELLEMAAKAVGFIDDQTSDDEDSLGLRRNGQGIFYVVGKRGWHNWNPLTDDGDALRLAVKLGLDVQMHGCNSMHPYAFAFDDARNIGEEEQPSDGDPYAATRRAIVRAAAEIGKAM